MKLDWAMLANYAEAPPVGGLVYIMGGTWDTMSVQAPLEGAPPGVVAVINGSLVFRLLFHPTELGPERTLRITITDEDGIEVGEVKGAFRPQKQPGLPPSWDHGFNSVIPLSGVGLPRFGLYQISIQIDGQHLGDRPFRVLKGY